MRNWNHIYTQAHFNCGLDYRSASAALAHAARAYNMYERSYCPYELAGCYGGNGCVVVRAWVDRLDAYVEASGETARDATRLLDGFIRALMALGISDRWRCRDLVRNVAVEFGTLNGLCFSLDDRAAHFCEFAYGHLYG